MRLSYWIAECIEEPHESMWLRGKTKKAVLADIELNRVSNCVVTFKEPRKVEIIYDDAFDLMDKCLTRRGYWE
jgi:hypothetical protein